MIENSTWKRPASYTHNYLPPRLPWGLVWTMSTNLVEAQVGLHVEHTGSQRCGSFRPTPPQGHTRMHQAGILP